MKPMESGLVLKLQEAKDTFSKSFEIATNLESFLLDCKSKSTGLQSVDSWNPILSKARFVLMIRIIAKLVEKEALTNDIVALIHNIRCSNYWKAIEHFMDRFYRAFSFSWSRC